MKTGNAFNWGPWWTAVAGRGFTLVELLVVITILVLLLALLAPAMEVAIYRAELTICGTRQKAVAGAMTVYAGEYRRWYPHNSSFERNAGWHGPLLRHLGTAVAVAGAGTPVANGVAVDMRPLLRPYLSINKTLMDPMIESIDLENAPEVLIYGSYSLWNGWKWATNTFKTTERQAKVGDRFDWRGPTGADPPIRWDILVTDFMRANLSGPPPAAEPDGGYWTSHPPLKGTSRLNKFRGQQLYTTAVHYFWIGNAAGRDEVDYNVARQDGSVQTYDQVGYNDPRLIDVAEWNTGAGDNDLYHQLPVR